MPDLNLIQIENNNAKNLIEATASEITEKQEGAEGEEKKKKKRKKNKKKKTGNGEKDEDSDEDTLAGKGNDKPRAPRENIYKKLFDFSDKEINNSRFQDNESTFRVLKNWQEKPWKQT